MQNVTADYVIDFRQNDMVRKLKHHEQKLLKKVDFLNVCSLLALWNCDF